MILITKTIKIELTDKERLIFSCADGDLEEAKGLLSSGQDVNTTDLYGHSLLWLACYRNQSDIVKLLLRYTNLNESKEKLSRDVDCYIRGTQRRNKTVHLTISRFIFSFLYFIFYFLPLRFS